MGIILGIVAIIATWKILGFFVTRFLDNARRKRLLEKYGDDEIVDLIMKSMFWQGQTPEQLVDSLGEPFDIDRKVLKSKTKETWKYNQVRKGQFALRIFLENNVVEGWDKKS